jgi:hypothetical protein
MQKSAKPTLPALKKPKRDLAGPAYRRFERMIMRPDDSLFVAGVVVSGALFAWLVASW